MIILEELHADSVVSLYINQAPYFGTALWVKCKIRKPHTCVGCKQKFFTGFAYRPINQPSYEHLRLCTSCFDVVMEKGNITP